MKTNLRNLFCLFLLISVTTVFQSCKKEGCTDPLSENFDDKADEDDGSCTYARTKFIGNYNAVENCAGDSYSYAMTIIESVEGADKLIIGNLFDYADVLTATVSGSTFTFSESNTYDGQELLYVGTGTFVDANTITISWTLSGDYYGMEQSVACTATLTRM